jgi:DNA-binding CsgD family transcriptional regulator
VIVVSHEGIVSSCNSAARAMLNNYHGLHIDPDNRLKAQTPEESKRLIAAIRDAALNQDETTWHLPLRETQSGQKRNLAISGLGHTDHGTGLSMVVIADPDRARVPSAKSLSDYFGLTPAEARLTHALAATSDLEDAASLSGLTAQSARTYLKRIFSKANVHSQGELMRIVFSLPVRYLKSA